MEEKNITYERPERIDPRNVIYWAEKDGMLLGDMKSKAKKFIELGCVMETDNPDL
jgi:hypothetical protein